MKKPFLLLAICCLSIAGYGQSDTYLLTHGGIPQTDTSMDIKVLYNTAYIVGYSDELKNPIWTAYRLGNPKVTSSAGKWERTRLFAEDPRTTSKVSHENYTGTGFDRGHMAPNASILDQYGQLAQLETFLMSNISPQKPDMNRNIWADLEAEERKLCNIDKANKEVHDVYIITGPIFNMDSLKTLSSGVAIPTAFYKIIAFQQGFGGTIKAASVVIPQNTTSTDFEEFFATVDEIEGLTGIDFFSELSATKQTNLESKKRNFKMEEIN